jgi:hypothetical protein
MFIMVGYVSRWRKELMYVEFEVVSFLWSNYFEDKEDAVN